MNIVAHGYSSRLVECKQFMQKFIANMQAYTLITGIPVEEGDSILKLLRRVSRPEIQLGMGIHSELDFLTVMEFTFHVRSKSLTFSLRKLSTSSFILNFSECMGNCSVLPLYLHSFGALTY